MTATSTRPASPAAYDLMITIGKEAREACTNHPGLDAVLTTLAGAIRRGEVTTGKQVSEMIDALKDLKAQARSRDRAAGRKSDPRGDRPEPKPGMYREPVADGNIYRVYLGQQSGKMLVKQVVGDDASGYSYEYLGAAAYRLPADAVPLGLDEAKAWGRMTGTCCVCARRLDNPESVDAGIGPVCASRMEDGFTK